MRQILVKLKLFFGNSIFHNSQTRGFYRKWFPETVYCQFKHSLRVRLVAVKCFPENIYFPEMLISGKGKYFPLFGCLGNRFPENQFWCLVRPNILRKSFYGKSIPVFGSSKHFTENTLRKSFYGKSIPVFGLWIILQKIWIVLQIQAPALCRQTCNSTKLIIHFNIKNNHSNWTTWIA